MSFPLWSPDPIFFWGLLPNFFLLFEKDTISFINYDYIKELKENYIECLLLSKLELKDVIKKDLINSNISLELVDYILDNCSFDKNNFIFNDKNNKSADCFNISDLILIINFNKTIKKLFDCENNCYNYSVIVFDDFNISYKRIHY